MEWIILILFMVLLIISVVSSSGNITNSNKSNKMIKWGGTYLGGSLKVFEVDIPMSFEIDNNKLVLSIKSNYYNITYDRLVDYSMKTETEIQQKVTLGRLLVLGVFALGAKKQVKKINKYGVLEFIDEQGQKQNVIFDAPNLVIKTILEEIHKRKIKYSNKISSDNKNIQM